MNENEEIGGKLKPRRKMLSDFRNASTPGAGRAYGVTKDIPHSAIRNFLVDVLDWRDSEGSPELVTIELGIAEKNYKGNLYTFSGYNVPSGFPDDLGDRYGPVAAIEWGVDGDRRGAVVDVASGAIIVVPATYVRISAAVMENIDYAISASVTKCGVARRSSAQITQREIGPFAVGANAIFAIPPYARKMVIHRSVNTPACHIELIDGNTLIAAVIPWPIGAGPLKLDALPGNVMSVHVYNDGPGAIDQFVAVTPLEF
jgi:hypothetical protein